MPHTSTKKQKAALLLLPNLLAETRHHGIYLPTSVDRGVLSLDGLFAESEQGGRRFLSHFPTERPVHLIPIALVNEHTADADLDFLLEPLQEGERWGLVSDAGLPCIADPGYKLVRRARQLGIAVQAYVGPSAITMALMLSGLPGQRFSFRGYLPKGTEDRVAELRKMEQSSRLQHETMITIEVPYRNNNILADCLAHLHDSTWLCVAWDLTLPTQGLVSMPIAQWKKITPPQLERKPAIYLISAGEAN